jgi:hypothetical protein
MNADSSMSESSLLKFNKRSVLLFIGLAIAGVLYLSYCGFVYRQRLLARDASDLMSKKGMDLLRDGTMLDFKNGNVTDSELKYFVHAFNGFGPSMFDKIAVVRLQGSNLSSDAIAEFQQAVPQCKLNL